MFSFPVFAFTTLNTLKAHYIFLFFNGWQMSSKSLSRTRMSSASRLGKTQERSIVVKKTVCFSLLTTARRIVIFSGEKEEKAFNECCTRCYGHSSSKI